MKDIEFRAGDEERVRDLIDPTLTRADLWLHDPDFLAMWAAYTHHFREEGRLKELLIRATQDVGIESLTVSIGLRTGSFQQITEGDLDTSTSTGGFLHFLPPFQVPETLTVISLLTMIPPWLSPSLSGFIGYPERDLTDRQWGITYEHPSQMLSGPPLGKERMERHHFDRFCTDYLLWHKSSPYDRIGRGGEPPDFLCTVGGKQRGVECSQFTVTERRDAFALFKRIRKEIVGVVSGSRSQFDALERVMEI